MIKFEHDNNNLILVYTSDQGPVSWIDKRLDSWGDYTFNRTFTITKDNVAKSLNGRTNGNDVRHFIIGSIDKDYQLIHKDVLGLKHDLRISTSIQLRKELFVASRDISIFGRIDNLVSEELVVGGDLPGAIPEKEFRQLLRNFPTSTELRRYADARVAQDLGEYFETMSDAGRRLSENIERRRNSQPPANKKDTSIQIANEIELEKFIFIRDDLNDMLENPLGYHESHWQKKVANLFLLIFPQYIAILENVNVREWYSNPPRATLRKFDLVLVNSDGYIDLIEIKIPDDNYLVTKKPSYRDNHIPLRALSGAVMQAEKYLFYLNKGGIEAERDITKDHKAQLPLNLTIKIASPKAIILSGRDNNLSNEQKFDLKLIRGKYSNVADIISYDDLLRRLDNIIAMLHRRSGL